MGGSPMPRKMAKVFCKFVCVMVVIAMIAPQARAQERLPLHVNAKVQKSVQKGLDWLAKNQGQDGNYPNSQDGVAYPVSMTGLAGMAFLAHGDTPTRGPYAENIHSAMMYCMGCAMDSGLIASRTEFSSYSMYG